MMRSAARARTSLNIAAMLAKHWAKVVMRMTARMLCSAVQDSRVRHPQDEPRRSLAAGESEEERIHHVQRQAEPARDERLQGGLQEGEQAELVDHEHGQRGDEENGYRLPEEPQEPVARLAGHRGEARHPDRGELLDELALGIRGEKAIEEKAGDRPRPRRATRMPRRSSARRARRGWRWRGPSGPSRGSRRRSGR